MTIHRYILWLVSINRLIPFSGTIENLLLNVVSQRQSTFRSKKPSREVRETEALTRTIIFAR